VLGIAASVALVALACAVALRPMFIGTVWPFCLIAIPYAGMSALFAWKTLRQEGGAPQFQESIIADESIEPTETNETTQNDLSRIFGPRYGDVATGFGVAGLLFLCAMLGRSVVAPSGTAREGWLIVLYMHVGEPNWVQSNVYLMTLIVGLVAALEEIAWRGFVMSELSARVGPRAAWPATAILNAIAYAPTMFLARDPVAGLNPLVVLSVLGCGLAWGFLVSRTGRLPVAVLSHAFFSSAAIIHFPFWRL
jgi:membrane protease YdiL (CAAX protease family)